MSTSLLLLRRGRGRRGGGAGSGGGAAAGGVSRGGVAPGGVSEPAAPPPRRRRSYPRHRVYRARASFLELSEEQVVGRYRLDKAAILALCRDLAADLASVTGRSHALPVAVKVTSALTFLATGSFQTATRQLTGISQSAMSNCLAQFLEALQRRAGRYIVFPEIPRGAGAASGSAFGLGSGSGLALGAAGLGWASGSAVELESASGWAVESGSALGSSARSSLGLLCGSESGLASAPGLASGSASSGSFPGPSFPSTPPPGAFPGVLGLVGSMHVALRAPSENEAAYRNAGNFHSVKMQVVCDAAGAITNVVAKFPGSCPNAAVLENSALARLLEGERPDGAWLLGDGSYPLKPWLMTPIAAPRGPAEERYNALHHAALGVLRRTLAHLRLRFRCLDPARGGGPLQYAPPKVCQIFLACCILHNIALRRRTQLPEGPPETPRDPPSPPEPPPQGQGSSEAWAVRARIVQQVRGGLG